MSFLLFDMYENFKFKYKSETQKKKLIHSIELKASSSALLTIQKKSA